MPAEAWLYVGGAVGVLYIFLSAALVAHTGVLLLGLGVVVGQLLTSIAIDALWPVASGPGHRPGDGDGRPGAVRRGGGRGAVGQAALSGRSAAARGFGIRDR